MTQMERLQQMNVEFHGYRPWAKQIEQNLIASQTDKWQISDQGSPDISLYYGWSWIIPKEVYEDHLCLILHPSPLPRYRGGSPLQHQIMNGERTSAVTILRVGEKLDAGELYSQTGFPLDGTLDDIFERIVEIGTADTIKVLNAIAAGTAQPIPQDESQATIYRRRKPEESRLTMEQIQTMSAEQLHNFIRALADPYPNAYIESADGKKLYFTGAHL